MCVRRRSFTAIDNMNISASAKPIGDLKVDLVESQEKLNWVVEGR